VVGFKPSKVPGQLSSTSNNLREAFALSDYVHTRMGLSGLPKSLHSSGGHWGFCGTGPRLAFSGDYLLSTGALEKNRNLKNNVAEPLMK